MEGLTWDILIFLFSSETLLIIWAILPSITSFSSDSLTATFRLLLAVRVLGYYCGTIQRVYANVLSPRWDHWDEFRFLLYPTTTRPTLLIVTFEFRDSATTHSKYNSPIIDDLTQWVLQFHINSSPGNSSLKVGVITWLVGVVTWLVASSGSVVDGVRGEVGLLRSALLLLGGCAVLK